jgi:uncharacterized membrane protein YidH (DUF202 family)
MKTIEVSLGDGPTSKLRWHPSTPDAVIINLVCGAVGLPAGSSIVLKDEEGYLVPCCNEISPGSFSVIHAPGPNQNTPVAPTEKSNIVADVDLSTNKESILKNYSTTGRTSETNNFSSHAPLRGTSFSGRPSGSQTFGIPSEMPRNSALSAIGSIPETRVSSIIEPILDNRMTKFERLTTHLANERTYLAWVRTAVSVIGLAVTYSSLASHHDPAVFWAGCSFSWLTGLAVFVVGCARYYKVKKVLGLPKSAITNRFQRTGINYIVFMFGLFLAFMSGEYMSSLYRDVN